MQFSKFYKLPVNDRFEIVNNRVNDEIDRVTVQTGGLSL